MKYQANHHTFALCAYKESPYLEECIQSLLNQSIQSNIIIATSTPCQYIEALAKRYDLNLQINDDQPGIGSDWNFAYSHTNTPLVTIAHQDDIYNPQYIEQMLKYINKTEDPVIYFCGYGEIRNGINETSNTLLNIKKNMLLPLKKQKNWEKINIRRKILSLGNPICCPAVTYIKSKTGEFNPFDISFKCDLDWDQWERLSKEEGAFVYNPAPLMYHRIHSGSETSALIENRTRINEDLEIFKRFWPDPIAKALTKFYALSMKSNHL